MSKAILVAISLLGLSQLANADSSVGLGDTAASVMITPSITKTKSITFLGENFIFNDKVDSQSGPMYEFFLPNESTNAWNELVSVGVYTSNLENHSPKDYAANLASGFKQRFPKSPVEIIADTNSTRVITDFIYPTSTRTDGKFFEFDAFVFFTDPITSKIMNIHYAKNIPMDPYLTGGKPISEFQSTITSIKEQALKEFTRATLYTP